MTIACPMFSDMRWARIRAALSTALAAARGTIIWIGRFGYADCAAAVENPAASAAARSMRKAGSRLDNIIPPYQQSVVARTRCDSKCQIVNVSTGHERTFGLRARLPGRRDCPTRL